MSIFTTVLAFLTETRFLAIPETEIGAFEKLFTSMARKAAKLNVEKPVAFKIGEVVPMPKEQSTIFIDPFTGYPAMKTRRFLVPCQVYGIMGARPRVDGKFRLCARIEFVTGAGLVHEVPGLDVRIPETYRQGLNVCDHCKKNRARKEAYILQDQGTGAFMQIGGQCIRDFLGNVSAADLAWKLSFLEAIDTVSSWEGGEGGLGSNRAAVDVETYLATCLAVIRNRGAFISVKSEDFMTKTLSTRTEADCIVFQRPAFDGHKLPKPTTDDFENAKSLIADARERFAAMTPGALDSYEWNLSVIVGCEGLYSRAARGLLASLPKYMERVTGKAAEAKLKAEKKESDFVGTVGKREVFDLTYTGHHTYESVYGLGSLYFFTDDAGNAFKWRSSSSLTCPNPEKPSEDAVTIGMKVRIKATVKEHSVYGNKKQTVISRAQVLEVLARPNP